jgi:hypothetical protein
VSSSDNQTPVKPASANLDEQPGPRPVEASAEPDAPVWLQRLFMIVYVVFCLQLGIWLVVLPWNDAWLSNNLLAHWPLARHLWEHPFLRGAVSGIGFLDLWLGISEAVHYRDRR